jgi:YVTN family beta-propeller protein
MKRWLTAIVTLALVQAAPADDVDRSPADLALSSDGAWIVTANETSGSVSLIDVEKGWVRDEMPCGDRPSAVVFSPNDRYVLVSTAYSGELVIFEIGGSKLREIARIALGFEPRGIAVTKDGKLAYVSLCASAEVALVDLIEHKVIDRIAVGRWPRWLTLSPDETRLAVGTSGDQSISVVDTHSRKLLYQEVVGGLNLGQMQASADGLYAYFPWMVYRHNPITIANIRKGWVLGSRVARVRLDGSARREAITTDPPGVAVADSCGIAMTKDERRMVVTASGTHELLVFGVPKLEFVAFGGPGDHIERALLADRENFYRIELGGRPMGVRLSADGRRAYVANWLANAVQVVDLEFRQVVQTIQLGSAPEVSLARRGAALFYDGRRSLDQWYSCHTCHYEGGANSEPMDTTNDGSTLTFKTVPSLVGVTETSPWTWHGWQKSLGDSIHVSMTETMIGPAPTPDEVRAITAFLATLDNPPNPYRLQGGNLFPQAEHGREVFNGATANCASCHSGPYFTDGEIHDVGLGSPKDVYEGYNTPSLVGLHRRVRYLHDGRAKSLDDLLKGPHSPERVSQTRALTAEERGDLIEYLKSL